MRIIKHVAGALTIIAGEMLNIETSTLHFLDGKPIGDGQSAESYRGYPKVIDGSVVNIIRSAFGYIYVPVGTDLNAFEIQLACELQRLEKEMVRPDGQPVDVLRTYHTVRAGYNTNIKVKSAQRLTELTAAHPGQKMPPGNRQATNVLRQFIQNPADSDRRRGRFTWCVKTIDQFSFEITSSNVEDAISRFICSVFYDMDNICKLNHNDTTFEFSRDMLKGSANIINEKKVILFKHGHPLLFELSEYWHHTAPSTRARDFLRNIQESKVYEIDYNSLAFNPIKLSESDDGESSTEVCTKCRSLLWGENYALAGSVKDPENHRCTLVCPVCMHTSHEDKPLEMKYFRVFRVKCPRTVEQMLDSPKITPERRNIFLESLKGIEKKESHSNGMNVTYTMIGDKYVSFDNIDSFLFTKLSIHPDFAARKVCTVYVIR